MSFYDRSTRGKSDGGLSLYNKNNRIHQQRRSFRLSSLRHGNSNSNSKPTSIISGTKLILGGVLIVIVLYIATAGYLVTTTTTTTTTVLRRDTPSNEQQSHDRLNSAPETENYNENFVSEEGLEKHLAAQQQPQPQQGSDNDDAAPSSHKDNTTVRQQKQQQRSGNSDDPTNIISLDTPDDFVAHRTRVQASFDADPTAFHRTTVLAAHLEDPLGDTVPGTGDRGDMDKDKDGGTPPDFVVPLPLRTQSPQQLRTVRYPNVQTCHDLPGKFPVDQGLQFEKDGTTPIVWNIGGDATPPDFAEQEVPYCPVEMDPFLPWIHDVFPSSDGTRIEFLAQNKRRCRTGSHLTERVNALVPQVALLQSVSVERVTDEVARQLAPNLWHPYNDDNTNDAAATTTHTPRYRLASHDEAAPDGAATRFICRFHATTVDDATGRPVTVPLGETLSEFPFNYELVSYRKGQPALLTPKGKDSSMFWTSNLHFSCPLPTDRTALQTAISLGDTLLDDGTPTVFVDVIPIRTSVRYEELHLTEDDLGPVSSWNLPRFNATTRWGPSNVLPLVEASGRWENIPICLPPELVTATTVDTETALDTFETTSVSKQLVPNIADLAEKPHFLSACLWASAEFKTRGKTKGATSDTLSRLTEWIEFHLLVGFDHIYVYDNSGAHTNETTLEPVLDLFPGRVTRIDWPTTVCNNNIPAHDSTGERSSQYAAENSCRTRYGPFTEWMAAFDTDEYFVPMGNYTSLKDVLRDAGKDGANILSLRSSRGRLRKDKSDGVNDGSAIEKSETSTYLEAYNCDSAGSPKPSWADRARKQIYRTDYVLYHYVHYSTVTQGFIRTYKQAKAEGKGWRRRFSESEPSERHTDELNEAVMVHTKSLARDMTASYKVRCAHDYEKKWQGCWVAFPWPIGGDPTETYDEQGMLYNCHINQRVDDYWGPILQDALTKRKAANL